MGKPPSETSKPSTEETSKAKSKKAHQSKKRKQHTQRLHIVERLGEYLFLLAWEEGLCL
jgi:hypothetical protein